MWLVTGQDVLFLMGPDVSLSQGGMVLGGGSRAGSWGVGWQQRYGGVALPSSGTCRAPGVHAVGPVWRVCRVCGVPASGTCHALGLSIEESQTPAGRGGWVGVDLDPDECCRVRVMRGPQMLHLWLWPRSHRPSHCPALLFGIIGVPILYSHTAAVEGWMNE